MRQCWLASSRIPPVSGELRRVSLRVALLVVIISILTLLAIPNVRAALLEWLQVGPIRIFFVEPTPIETTGTPVPTPTLLPSLLDITGKTTLDDAQEKFPIPIKLPAYPPDLGPPQYVFLQDMHGPVLVLAWADPEQPSRVGLSLHQIGPGSFALEKVQPQVVQSTEVNGRPAVWTVGPYILLLRNGNIDARRLISGHVLIWQEAEITYRLETDLSLEEAVKIAESLEIWKEK